jgi:hypothetical protein
MQVETDDFILSLTSVGVENDEQTEVITTEVSDLPPDLVNTDVTDLVSFDLLKLNHSFNVNLDFECTFFVGKQPFSMAWIRRSIGIK